MPNPEVQPGSGETLQELAGDTYTITKARDASTPNDWTIYKVCKWAGKGAPEPLYCYQTGYSDSRGMVCDCPGGQQKVRKCKHMDLVLKYRRQGEPEGAWYHWDEPNDNFVRVAAQRRFGGIQSLTVGQDDEGRVVLQYLIPYQSLGFSKECAFWKQYESDPDYITRLTEDLQVMLQRNIGFLTGVLTSLGVTKPKWLWLEAKKETDYSIQKGTPDLLVFQTIVGRE